MEPSQAFKTQILLLMHLMADPATNAMNESETAGAYVALDMKFINVNKLRVQFKGTRQK